MKKKRYLVMPFLLQGGLIIYLPMIVASIWMMFFSINRLDENQSLIVVFFMGIFSIISLTIIFFEMVQIVEFNENGVAVRNLWRKIKFLAWNDVIEIGGGPNYAGIRSYNMIFISDRLLTGEEKENIKATNGKKTFIRLEYRPKIARTIKDFYPEATALETEDKKTK